ncbi:hypothetical protein GN157_05210 [Flavobacterium rakeshii]|uniref:Uncharacterized protein n=1 Tax=Flavobacterium rakeshii TaxID=1038845 RepID=A0A6N8HAX9_9FLAO|nr:hypothetical protein [Flavobacterium rakeshii]MUV03103.1 hypothetical protein [Flavobacterium rakeshii]
MKKTFYVFLFFILLIVVTGIFLATYERKKIPEGKEIFVSGRSYDNINDEPVVDQMITVAEYNIKGIKGFPGYICNFVKGIDTVWTDVNGNYNINFKASGKGNTYMVSPFPDVRDNLWALTENREEITDTDNQINFSYLKLYPLDLSISLADDIKYLPFTVSHKYTQYSLQKVKDKEYIGILCIDKNTINEVTLTRILPNGSKQTSIIKIPATNTKEWTEFNVYLTNEDFLD